MFSTQSTIAISIQSFLSWRLSIALKHFFLFWLCGFMPGLSGQYTVLILEEKSVWRKNAPMCVAYMDTKVITLCERLVGQAANVTSVPVSVLGFTRPLTQFSQWTNDIADRLAFTERLLAGTCKV